MQQIAQYEGTFLNHMEGIYRPGDRELAIELVEALGLVPAEIQFTAKARPTLAVHPNGSDRDPTNNVFFLYEMPQLQRRVVDLMSDRTAADPELREAVAAYRTASAQMPALMPHFGLRYRSAAELQAVMDRLENGISPALKERVGLFEMPSYEPIEGLPDIRQVFVRTDVFSVGAAGMEQAIELQVDRARP